MLTSHLRTILSIAVLFAFTSLRVNAQWLPDEAKIVKAYVYDYTQEKDNPTLLKSWKLHSGVINKEGAALSDEQIIRLKKALISAEPRAAGAFCYMPHHGFVFYSASGRPLGHIELCFQCHNVDSSPKGLPEKEWNWEEIRKILEELKLPILDKDEDYTKLFNGSRIRQK
jgi:hypothetical protein